jgi:hypothetical protein
MRTSRSGLLAAAMVAFVWGTLGLNALAQNIQTELPASNWPSVLSELKDLRPDKAPYHFSKRSRAYDHEVFILTPMVRAAAFVRANEKTPEAITPEALTRAMDRDRFVVEVTSSHRAIDKSREVQAKLKIDGKVVEPYQDSLLVTQLKSVGFYAEQYYFTTRQFAFITDDVKAAKTLSILLVEADGKSYELPVDLSKLR